MAQNTISTNLLADKGFDKDTARTAAVAAGVGVAATKKQGTTSGSRRRLLQTSDSSSYELSPAEAYSTISAAATNIAALMSKDLSPGQGASVAGDENLCVGVARERGASLGDFTISFADCAPATDAGTGARRRLLAESVNGSATISAGYAAWCAANTACAAANAATVTATYKPDASVVTDNMPLFPNLTQLSYSSNVTVITGTVQTALSTSADGYVCNATSTNGCTVTVSLPVNTTLYDSNKTTQCYRADSTGSGSLVANATEVATGTVVGGMINCTGAKLGEYFAVQYTRNVPNDIANTTTGPATQNTTGGYQDLNSYVDDASKITGDKQLGFTFIFQMDYQATFYPGGQLNTTAMEEFKLLTRKSFLANIAATSTSLNVSAANGALQLARVQVLRVFQSSIGTDLTFTAPVGTTDAQLASLSSLIQANPATFFNGAFANKYGSVAVAARPLATGSSGLSTGAVIGIAVGAGVGGLAIIAIFAGYVVQRRRRQTLGSPNTTTQFEQVPSRVY